jgi:hypothetical protein
MDVFLTVIAILAMVALGVFLIHRLDTQHHTRIATFHYSDPMPGVRRRPVRRHRPSGGTRAGQREGKGG